MTISSSDVKRANYHQRLFEMVKADTDPKQDEKGRQKEACSIMEQLLGKGWDKEANIDGMDMITVVASDDPLHEAGEKHDLGPAPEKSKGTSNSKKERILATLRELLDEL